MHIVLAKLSQADVGENEMKFMMKHDPEWALIGIFRLYDYKAYDTLHYISTYLLSYYP